MSNALLNKLKSPIKNETEVTLYSNLIRSSNNEANFLYKLLLTDTQVSKVRQASVNGSSTNVKFWKTRFSKTIQSGGILTELIAAIPQAMFLAGKEVLKAVLETTGKATEYYINKGINNLNTKFRSSKSSGIAIANNELKDIVKVIKSIENRGILLKGRTREITSQQGGFLNFPRLLVTTGLPLMKRVLTLL